MKKHILKVSFTVLFIILFLHFNFSHHFISQSYIALPTHINSELSGKQYLKEIIIYKIPKINYNWNHEKIKSAALMFAQEDCNVLYAAQDSGRLSFQSMVFYSLEKNDIADNIYPISSKILSKISTSVESISEYCYILIRRKSTITTNQHELITTFKRILLNDSYFNDNYMLIDEFPEVLDNQNSDIIQIYRKKEFDIQS